MRITCSASALILLTAACSAPPRQNPPAETKATVVDARSEDGRTRLDLQVGQDRRSLLVERDDTVAPDAPPPKISVVGEMPGRALVVTETYPSRPGGLSYCQAGEEQFLRVISIANGGAASTFVAKLASCRGNLEMAEPGLQWDAPTSTVRIHWLSGPSGAVEDRTIAIGADGSVTTSSK